MLLLEQGTLEFMSGDPMAPDNISPTSSRVAQVSSLFAQTNLHTIPSSRLNEISQEERMEALQDLHGASDLVEEDPWFVEEKLNELDRQLLLFDDTEKQKAYDEAARRNASYVLDLRLPFLRAEKFNISKTVVRMLAHFSLRYRLFDENPEILGRDIRFSDLHQEDKDSVRAGKFQLLAHADRTGRPIIFVFPKKPSISPPDAPYSDHPWVSSVSSWGRIIMWYGILATRMGDEAQKKGLVFVWYGLGVHASPVGHSTKVVEHFFRLPIGLNSVQACYDDPSCTSTMNELAREGESGAVFRMRTHFGGHAECQSSLSTYGIPRQMLPVRKDGSVRLEEHEQFLRQVDEHQVLQQKLNSRVSVQPGPENRKEAWVTASVSGDHAEITPGPMDVVLGRGKRGSKFPGKLMLRKLLEENLADYDCGTRKEKKMICERIYRQMKQAGCRFLAPVELRTDAKAIGKTAVDRSYRPDGWREVDESEGWERIAHRLRNIRQSKGSS